MDVLKETLRDDFKYYDEPLSLLKSEIQKIEAPVLTSSVLNYLNDKENKDMIKNCGITQNLVKILLEKCEMLESKALNITGTPQL
jgi:hypothetical protein